MPNKYMRYVWEMSEIILRHTFLCLIHGQNKAEKCLIYPCDMPEISVRNAWNECYV